MSSAALPLGHIAFVAGCDTKNRTLSNLAGVRPMRSICKLRVLGKGSGEVRCVVVTCTLRPNTINIVPYAENVKRQPATLG